MEALQSWPCLSQERGVLRPGQAAEARAHLPSGLRSSVVHLKMEQALEEVSSRDKATFPAENWPYNVVFFPPQAVFKGPLSYVDQDVQS